MRTPKTKSGTRRTTGGTTISATSNVTTTDALETITVFSNQRGNWSLTAARKPPSEGLAIGAQGWALKLSSVLNAALSITYTGNSARTLATIRSACFENVPATRRVLL